MIASPCMTRSHAQHEKGIGMTTVMARIPESLAQEVHAYATTHHIPVSTLVRTGLSWVIRQPPLTLPAPPSKHASSPQPQRTKSTLSTTILDVVATFPDGVSVNELWTLLATTTPLGRYREDRARLRQITGTCLRGLYRAGRVARLAHGVYAPLATLPRRCGKPRPAPTSAPQPIDAQPPEDACHGASA